MISLLVFLSDGKANISSMLPLSWAALLYFSLGDTLRGGGSPPHPPQSTFPSSCGDWWSSSGGVLVGFLLLLAGCGVQIWWDLARSGKVLLGFWWPLVCPGRVLVGSLVASGEFL